MCQKLIENDAIYDKLDFNEKGEMFVMMNVSLGLFPYSCQPNPDDGANH